MSFSNGLQACSGELDRIPFPDVQQFVGLPLTLTRWLQSLSWQAPRPVAGAASANEMPNLHVSSGCSDCLIAMTTFMHNKQSCAAARASALARDGRPNI